MIGIFNIGKTTSVICFPFTPNPLQEIVLWNGPSRACSTQECDKPVKGQVVVQVVPGPFHRVTHVLIHISSAENGPQNQFRHYKVHHNIRRFVKLEQEVLRQGYGVCPT
jgi:hypothetical protein